MASIIDTQKAAATGKIKNTSDKTPIEADGGLNLSIDEIRLKKARGGVLNTKFYSDTVKKD